jgi:hypothetical protein
VSAGVPDHLPACAAGLELDRPWLGHRRADQRRRDRREMRWACTHTVKVAQTGVRSTVWTQAENYFRAGTGKVISQWPFSASAYIVALALAARIAIRFTDHK